MSLLIGGFDSLITAPFLCYICTSKPSKKTNNYQPTTNNRQAARAHLHIGEVRERLSSPPADSPLAAFTAGQPITAAYLGHIKGLAGRRGKEVELSLRPSALAAAKKVRARSCCLLLPHQY
jgi:hypothetical protein